MKIRPFSQACENNKKPIGKVLKTAFKNSHSVLEIGSGTGQHAVYFSSLLPHLSWQTSDCSEQIAGINLWLDECTNSNVHRPIELDVNQLPWPVECVDAIFSANTLHIMSWSSVENFFRGVKKTLKSGGVLCVYGPFNYNGKYTSTSNADFDCWLKKQATHQALRDVADVVRLAEQADLTLLADYPMPTNNRLLKWRKYPWI